jgi:hypothetical protein
MVGSVFTVGSSTVISGKSWWSFMQIAKRLCERTLSLDSREVLYDGLHC